MPIPEWSVEQWTGFWGGIAGCLVGLLAALYALRNSLKNAKSATEKRRMWLSAAGMLAFVFTFLTTLAFAPQEYRAILFLPYGLLLWLIIHATNRWIEPRDSSSETDDRNQPNPAA